jgi:hypothetical protein
MNVIYGGGYMNVVWGGGCISRHDRGYFWEDEEAEMATMMSYEEEDTCMPYEEEDTCMSYEEEDTCMSYEEEDTCIWDSYKHNGTRELKTDIKKQRAEDILKSRALVHDDLKPLWRVLLRTH